MSAHDQFPAISNMILCPVRVGLATLLRRSNLASCGRSFSSCPTAHAAGVRSYAPSIPTTSARSSKRAWASCSSSNPTVAIQTPSPATATKPSNSVTLRLRNRNQPSASVLPAATLRSQPDLPQHPCSLAAVQLQLLRSPSKTASFHPFQPLFANPRIAASQKTASFHRNPLISAVFNHLP